MSPRTHHNYSRSFSNRHSYLANSSKNGCLHKSPFFSATIQTLYFYIPVLKQSVTDTFFLSQWCPLMRASTTVFVTKSVVIRRKLSLLYLWPCTWAVMVRVSSCSSSLLFFAASSVILSILRVSSCSYQKINIRPYSNIELFMQPCSNIPVWVLTEMKHSTVDSDIKVISI